MGKVVNLTKARKARARSLESAEAAENRVRHGRTKAERLQAATETAAAATRLDGHKREPGS